ncbi:MAG: DUF2752 domain-containing protein [Oscillospiraceae bacterium]|nr:DUF2752 domain-containing protein [Oscillospiraceae bacterium]
MKHRLKKLAILSAALLLAGCIYAWLCDLLGWGIPCPIRLATGLLCPGCGVSRMCMALLRLDFAAAWQANPAILCLLPLLLAIAVDMAVRYVRTGSAAAKGWSAVATWVAIVVLVIFGIARNL